MSRVRACRRKQMGKWPDAGVCRPIHSWEKAVEPELVDAAKRDMTSVTGRPLGEVNTGVRFSRSYSLKQVYEYGTLPTARLREVARLEKKERKAKLDKLLMAAAKADIEKLVGASSK